MIAFHSFSMVFFIIKTKASKYESNFFSRFSIINPIQLIYVLLFFSLSLNLSYFPMFFVSKKMRFSN